MQNLENPVLQLFLVNLIEALKEENNSYERNDVLDIPFIISSLYQSFENNPKKYKEFSESLQYYNYNISIVNSRNDWNGIIDIHVYPLDNHEDEANWYYEIQFEFEDRPWGYCVCTPDMPDYRKDKHCCGHGCDAIFSSFSLYKVEYVANDSWHGDEHSYWEFEDEFYKDESELKKKREIERKETERKMLKNKIEEMTKKLKELESEIN